MDRLQIIVVAKKYICVATVKCVQFYNWFGSIKSYTNCRTFQEEPPTMWAQLFKLGFEFLISCTRKILRHFKTRGSWYGDERPFLDRVRLGYWILVNSAIWSERPRQYSISRSNELLPHFYTLKSGFYHIVITTDAISKGLRLWVFFTACNHILLALLQSITPISLILVVDRCLSEGAIAEKQTAKLFLSLYTLSQPLLPILSI